MPTVNPNSPRYRRIFAQQQTGSYPANFRTINNAAGTWSSTGAQFIRAEEGSVSMVPDMPITPVSWLTGTRSAQPGIAGRKAAGWELRNLPLIPSGTGGTKPDTDIFWQNIFGSANTATASNNAYSFSDTGYLPFTLLDFAHGLSSLTNRLIWGCFVTEFMITLNGNVLVCDFRGRGGYLLDSTNFSNEDTIAKAGLSSYPTEPGAATYAGNIIPGFGATLTIDSQSGLEQKVRSMQIRGTTGFQVIGDVLADAYPIQAVGGLRQCAVSIGMLDDDSATLNDIKQKAKQEASISFSLVVGSVTGSKMTIGGNNLQFPPNGFRDEGNVVMADFPEGLFHASAVGNTDDISVTFS